MNNEKFVIIHGDKWKLSDLIDSVEVCKKTEWHKQKWKSSPALFDKSGDSSRKYRGQKYDPDKFELVEDGWGHDHCEICWWTLDDSPNEENNVGYTDGHSWICIECYEHFINEEGST